MFGKEEPTPRQPPIPPTVPAAITVTLVPIKIEIAVTVTHRFPDPLIVILKKERHLASFNWKESKPQKI